ncbi:MAG: DMT family transporter [Nevskiales bacterium]
MNPGVLYAIFACAAWGFAFIGPLILGAWTATAVAGGRYIAYGLWSLIALGVMRVRSGPQSFDFRKWRDATLFTLAGNLLYYTLMSESLKRSGVFLTTLIIGLLPVTISTAGRLRARQRLTPAYAAALVLIVAGLFLANQPGQGAQASSDWIGLACAFGALALWTGYGVLNADWLHAHPKVGGLEWSSLQGAAALPFALALFAASPHPPQNAAWPVFITVSLLLGIITSWAANAAWNMASTRVPGSLLGQLIVFETIAGIAYGALWSKSLPAVTVLAGAALLIAGVIIAMRERPPEITA